MIFHELPLKGAYLVELQFNGDYRGYFTRVYCKDIMAKAGIDFKIVQSNMSFSLNQFTLRGLHYQTGIYAEKKLVRCMHGKILDVMIDLRNDSETFGKHYKVELSHESNLMVLIPEGFAHGFLTLEPGTVVFYQVNKPYNSYSQRSVRWNDPYFGIEWPAKNPILSEGDATYPDFLKPEYL